ncbi:MAG: hypothetical protein H6702_19765 [Myxococcales bacterium]|nr:hypothetical protein [Myxococcales bacterium]
MFGLIVALAVTPAAPTPGPTDVVVYHDLLVACHRPTVGWFTGPACEAAALGGTLRKQGVGERKLAMKATDASCGGTEGYRALGSGHSDGLWSTRAQAPAITPLPTALKAGDRKALRALLAADFAEHAAAWRTWVEEKDAVAMDPTAFKVVAAARVGDARYLSLQGMTREFRALVRLGKAGGAVLARDAYGPVTLAAALDADGDGEPELWVAEGGETERSYTLLRFIDGRPSPIASLGCGD